jgi:light-regulated signal transduction histidine kinase (bacteriophytochrome)
MQNAAHRMQTLINDLLELTRVTSKARPFTMIDLNQTVREVLSDMETRIQECGATVDLDPLPVLEADSTQMRQLFQNLISNALKFRRRDVKPHIKIKARIMVPSTRDLCRILVEDNGIGFDNQYKDQIFKVFERLHGREEYQGTGIGLAICRKVVERHGGTITAEGKPGNGCVFSITLPLKQAPKGENE